MQTLLPIFQIMAQFFNWSNSGEEREVAKSPFTLMGSSKNTSSLGELRGFLSLKAVVMGNAFLGRLGPLYSSPAKYRVFFWAHTAQLPFINLGINNPLTCIRWCQSYCFRQSAPSSTHYTEFTSRYLQLVQMKEHLVFLKCDSCWLQNMPKAYP